MAPPDTVAHPAIDRLPAPSLSTLPDDTPLVLGLSAVDRSGRIRDRVVLAALSWHPGDRTHAVVRDAAVLIHRIPTGGVAIDARGRVFLPAGARALLGTASDARIVLLADPQHDLLIVHCTRAVTALLATLHRAAVVAIDAIGPDPRQTPVFVGSHRLRDFSSTPSGFPSQDAVFPASVAQIDVVVGGKISGCPVLDR